MLICHFLNHFSLQGILLATYLEYNISKIFVPAVLFHSSLVKYIESNKKNKQAKSTKFVRIV